MLFGIPDPWVWGAYALCILSTLLCIFWGVARWNRPESLDGPPDASPSAEAPEPRER